MVNSLGPTVLTLSSTWLSAGVESSILMVEGYELYRSDRATTSNDGTTKVGGGLTTYLLVGCRVDTAKYSHLTRSDGDVESQILVVNKGGDKGAVIINMYRPPKGNIPAFTEYISQIMNILDKERYRDVYIFGDLNLDHSSKNLNEQVRKIQSLMRVHSFNQVIKQPTRRTIRSESTLDVIYVRTQRKVPPSCSRPPLVITIWLVVHAILTILQTLLLPSMVVRIVVTHMRQPRPSLPPLIAPLSFSYQMLTWYGISSKL